MPTVIFRPPHVAAFSAGRTCLVGALVAYSACQESRPAQRTWLAWLKLYASPKLTKNFRNVDRLLFSSDPTPGIKSILCTAFLYFLRFCSATTHLFDAGHITRDKKITPVCHLPHPWRNPHMNNLGKLGFYSRLSA